MRSVAQYDAYTTSSHNRWLSLLSIHSSSLVACVLFGSFVQAKRKCILEANTGSAFDHKLVRPTDRHTHTHTHKHKMHIAHHKNNRYRTQNAHSQSANTHWQDLHNDLQKCSALVWCMFVVRGVCLSWRVVVCLPVCVCVWHKKEEH